VGLAQHLKDKHGQVGTQAFQTVLLAPPAPPPRKPKPKKPWGVRLPCPDCGATLKLREGKYGLFYGCSNWPVCTGAHGAHPDGQPLGVPVDKETRKIRIAAHAALELTWEPGPSQVFGSRGQAYEWVQKALGLTADEAHIAKFDAAMCKRLIEALWTLDGPDSCSPACP
jgi:hypothetical protein